MDEDTPPSRRSLPTSRRAVLGTSAVAFAGLPGCLGGRDETDPTPVVDRPTEEETDDPPTDRCETPEMRDSDDPLVVEFDSREALGCRGTRLDGFEDLSRWETYDGSTGADLSTVSRGTQSARLVASEDQSLAWIYRRFEDGLDLSDRDLSLAVHPGADDTRSVEIRLQLLAPDRDNRVEMWHGIDDVGGWVRLDFGPTEFVGDPDLTDVREIRIKSLPQEGRTLSCNVDELRTTPKVSDPVAVVTFDGIHETQYRNAFQIMDRYGFSGSVGVTPELVGGTDSLSVGRLSEMRDAGWDVVSNPARNRPLSEYTREEQEAAIRTAKQWLVDKGFEEGARFVHWPEGRLDETTLDVGAKYHYLGFLGGGSPTGRITGPQTVTRVDGDDVERTFRTLELAERSGQSVVIEYHTVGYAYDNRASIEQFNRTMRRLDRLGFQVVTPSELWEMQSPEV
ncbi:Peptidoglycan/xylan/chitin deacetylase, PgdA/CDA1 family [Halopelagius inordinatus]|uniref:Peptidoglycan/xylan/chitin deacetylase, PgdA/CDA1 family n=1 Tax=Halopelagius inordinatus TaxID=553467 RepID=A0A1I2UAB5_9EURY|nr:polysaccharide deacetylase family protein [Halopelagius inordinatus]SFG74074.1 Peptidoglycan/xylan/chitin deacetylase, PgdA/CDA1 family [Halopelagius inordinatus]